MAGMEGHRDGERQLLRPEKGSPPAKRSAVVEGGLLTSIEFVPMALRYALLEGSRIDATLKCRGAS